LPELVLKCMYALLQNVFVVGDVYASLSSFADASQISVPIHGILCVRLKFTHTALSKPPINGILRALWQCCRPINEK